MEDIVGTEETTGVEALVLPPPGVPGRVSEELATQLIGEARAEGVDLVGPGGLLGDLTKPVLQASLEAGELAQRDPVEDGDHRHRAR